MRLRLPAARRHAGDRPAGTASHEALADGSDTLTDGYLADGYADEHLTSGYAAAGHTLVDRPHSGDAETAGFVGEHEPVPDAEKLRRRLRRFRSRTRGGGPPALFGRAFAAVTVA